MSKATKSPTDADVQESSVQQTATEEAPSTPETDEYDLGDVKIKFKDETLMPNEKVIESDRRKRPKIDPKDVVPENRGYIGRDYFTEADDWVATTVGCLPSGREVQIRKVRDGWGYAINFESPVGVVPKEMNGKYTSFEQAKKAVLRYLTRQWDFWEREQAGETITEYERYKKKRK